MQLAVIIFFLCIFIASMVAIVRHQQGKAALRPALVTFVLGIALSGGLLTFVYQQGSRVPEAQLVDMNEQTGVLSDYFDGRPMIVNLWASWCPPCVREMPLLEAAEQANPDVRFIFINQREHPDVVAEFLVQHSLDLATVLRDHSGDFSAAVGAHVMPTTLFFDADARLQKRFYGEVNQAVLDQGFSLIQPTAD
ncbi:TlpA family protein disulfide reductase [Aliidiomarina maris]|uniref:Thiol-disulfide isomerase/thioredoxin n=1 Tax=Aliidiomarina maris TaxID=531312 RepID=A0A327X1J5_9GAMM|nr:TlpA disulfide reductase family protein [Aliidiomarina maris]RAJ98425.1 thiol-disulfide isomerase/thioredoxin [Aliidiomarina maris]RUO24760.1 hypothetical protein CWE07_06865 [Aliidiomarina maris]